MIVGIGFSSLKAYVIDFLITFFDRKSLMTLDYNVCNSIEVSSDTASAKLSVYANEMLIYDFLLASYFDILFWDYGEKFAAISNLSLP